MDVIGEGPNDKATGVARLHEHGYQEADYQGKGVDAQSGGNSTKSS